MVNGPVANQTTSVVVPANSIVQEQIGTQAGRIE